MNEDRVVALLVEIRDLLRERGGGHVAAPPPARSLSAADRRRLEVLLPVLENQFPDGCFVWEAFDVVAAGGVAGNDMKIALADLSTTKAGKLLRKAADSNEVVAGHRVSRAGAAGGAVTWRVVRVDPIAPSFSRDALAGKVKAFDARRMK